MDIYNDSSFKNIDHITIVTSDELIGMTIADRLFFQKVWFLGHTYHIYRLIIFIQGNILK